jgi:hypothetical protein
MIDDYDVSNWRELQNSVCRLFNEVGLIANTEVPLSTPRGVVEVDVYAVDERSIDKVSYIVECKNWSSTVPQHVVHSFTTVMQEAGANIGYIVSREGLQSGAEKYTKNTNIRGLTYQDLQIHYFEAWWRNYFCVNVANAAENVCFYTEPFNIRRNECLENLSSINLDRFNELRNKWAPFSMLMWHHDIKTMIPNYEYGMDTPTSIEEYKQKFVDVLGEDFSFESECWRDLLNEICGSLRLVEQELHSIFGKNIFEDRKPNK